MLTGQPLLQPSNKMPLVFSAIIPHSPLLIPHIGKENLALLKDTLSAAETLAAEFKEACPELVIVLSNYGPKRQSGFTMNVAPDYKSDLSAFGDLVTDLEYSGSLATPARFRELLEGKTSLQLTTQENLDYGSVIPLFLLQVNSATPIFPISPSGGSLNENFEFGKLLQSCLLSEDKKIAVIASADFSHKLNKKSPAGFSTKAKKLDQKVIDCLLRSDLKEILGLAPKALHEALIEDLNVVAVFLGLLEGFNRQSHLLSHESPFGVGHAVVAYRS